MVTKNLGAIILESGIGCQLLEMMHSGSFSGILNDLALTFLLGPSRHDFVIVNSCQLLKVAKVLILHSLLEHDLFHSVTSFSHAII